MSNSIKPVDLNPKHKTSCGFKGKKNSKVVPEPVVNDQTSQKKPEDPPHPTS